MRKEGCSAQRGFVQTSNPTEVSGGDYAPIKVYNGASYPPTNGRHPAQFGHTAMFLHGASAGCCCGERKRLMRRSGDGTCPWWSGSLPLCLITCLYLKYKLEAEWEKRLLVEFKAT